MVVGAGFVGVCTCVCALLCGDAAAAALLGLKPHAEKLLSELTMLDSNYHWMGPDPRQVPMRESQRTHALLRIRLAQSILRTLAAADERKSRAAREKVRLMQKERIRKGLAMRSNDSLPSVRPSCVPRVLASARNLQLMWCDTRSRCGQNRSCQATCLI